jgi:ABC-2 type transport system permease protein
MMDLIRSELLRIWSRRMVKVLAVVAVVGATAGVVIGAVQSHPPDLVTAQRNFDDDLQHCLAGDFVPEDQLPPGETLERFCADNVRFENYVNDSLRLAELSDILKGTSFILIVLGLVIGASSVGADWQAGTMAALLTWEPRRVRIFLVRAAVVLGSVFVLAVALQCVLALELAAAAALRGTTVGTGSPWLRGVAGTVSRIGLAAAFGASLGVALAMVGRNTAAALGVAFGYLAIVESLLRGFIPKISPSLISTNLVVLVDGRAGRSDTGSLIAVGGASITIAVYAAVSLVAALVLFRTRDVT